jgi:hypothetical protein
MSGKDDNQVVTPNVTKGYADAKAITVRVA